MRKIFWEVEVLRVGYSKWINSCRQLAGSTISLIRGAANLIVDTGNPHDADLIRKALSKERLKCSAINYVICTHGHSDHIGCNALFPEAIHLTSSHLYKHDILKRIEYPLDGYTLKPGIKVFHTPGHTLDDISVQVSTKTGTIGIVGDLFENANDRKNPLIWETQSECKKNQKKWRDYFLKTCDFIVPGHGNIFPTIT